MLVGQCFWKRILIKLEHIWHVLWVDLSKTEFGVNAQSINLEGKNV